jgi:Cysteine-rich secretory protein family
MARSQFRRSLRFENLEGRQLLSTAGPTNQEQYMLQLLNEARTDPAAVEAQITSSANLTPDILATLKYYNVNLQQVEQTIGNATPQPPLAWNQDLANAAQGQSQYEANTQTQTHTGGNGSTPQQRIEAAGYSNPTSSGENTYAYASSVMQSMQAFLMDWGVPSDGHRINIQQPGVAAQNAYTSVGIGLVNTSASNSSFGPMVVTQDFGSQANTQAQVVGVAFNDTAGTGFYLPGEGAGGVQIDAVNLKTGAVSSTQTWSSGGYELSLASGQYRIIASQNNKVIQTSNVTINNVNVEQDFVLTNTWQGGTRAAAIAAAQPQVAPPVTIQAPTTTNSPVKIVGTLANVATSTQPISSTVVGTVAKVATSTQPISSSMVGTLANLTPSAQPSSSTVNAPSSFLAMFANSWSAWNAN